MGTLGRKSGRRGSRRSLWFSVCLSLSLPLVLGSGLVAIQFKPVAMSNPPVAGDFDGPAEVKAVFQRTCYDCHSNQTVWPWYARVAPVSWWISDHVKNGRTELNFSKWTTLSDRRISSLKEDILDEIESGKMPGRPYTLMHPTAALSGSDKEIIRHWAEEE